MAPNCSKCGCPLACAPILNVGPFLFCNMDFEMWLAVASNPFFLRAQQEMLDDIVRKNAIIHGD